MRSAINRSSATRAPFARLVDLDRIEFTVTGISAGNISARARRTLAFFLALIRLGYVGIRAPMDAIARAQWRSSNGESRSSRNLRRALAELEQAGFCRRLICRQGSDRKGAVIAFNVPAFAFWTRSKYGKVLPAPTSVHIPIHRTNCPATDRTRTINRVNSCNSVESSYKKPSEPIRDRFRGWRHPIIFTLLVILKTAPDRRKLVARAECELKAREAGVILSNPSGVDWGYWEPRWRELSPSPGGARENTARLNIVPALRNAGAPIPAEELPAEELPAELLDNTPPTAEEIRIIREQLETPIAPAAARPAAARPAAIKPFDGMDILIRARERARASRWIDDD